jgi:hypothetical protein
MSDLDDDSLIYNPQTQLQEIYALNQGKICPKNKRPF